jgi:Immunity protein Imm5
MQLPEQSQKLVTHYLDKVRQDPAHHLKPIERLEIYESFNSDNDEVGRKAFVWLHILSARKVEKIWNTGINDYYLRELGSQLLTLAEDILTGLVSKNSKIVKRVADSTYHAFGNIEDFPDNVVCSITAAEDAFNVAIGFKPFKPVEIDDETLDENLWDEQVWDAPSNAMRAYANFYGYYEENENEEAEEVEISGQMTRILTNAIVSGKSDPQKRLEFWEWWLTEAIPQAWEIAHTKATRG